MRTGFTLFTSLMVVCASELASAGKPAPSDASAAANAAGKQVAAFKDLWVEFANGYYDVTIDGGPKIGAANEGKKKVCFSFKAQPDADVSKKFVAGLKKASAGDRPLLIGKDKPVGAFITAATSARWGQSRELGMGMGRGKASFIAFYDFTSEILQRPPKVNLTLPGIREVVVRTGGKVKARIPFLVSMDMRGDGFGDVNSIHVPDSKCSGWISADALQKDTTATVEVIDLSVALARIED